MSLLIDVTRYTPEHPDTAYASHPLFLFTIPFNPWSVNKNTLNLRQRPLLIRSQVLATLTVYPVLHGYAKRKTNQPSTILVTNKVDTYDCTRFRRQQNAYQDIHAIVANLRVIRKQT